MTHTHTQEFWWNWLYWNDWSIDLLSSILWFFGKVVYDFLDLQARAFDIRRHRMRVQSAKNSYVRRILHMTEVVQKLRSILNCRIFGQVSGLCRKSLVVRLKCPQNSSIAWSLRNIDRLYVTAHRSLSSVFSQNRSRLWHCIHIQHDRNDGQPLDRQVSKTSQTLVTPANLVEILISESYMQLH